MFDNQSKDLTVHIIINGNIEYFHVKEQGKSDPSNVFYSTLCCKAIYIHVPYVWNNMKRCLISWVIKIMPISICAAEVSME